MFERSSEIFIISYGNAIEKLLSNICREKKYSFLDTVWLNIFLKGLGHEIDYPIFWRKFIVWGLKRAFPGLLNFEAAPRMNYCHRHFLRYYGENILDTWCLLESSSAESL